MVSTDHNITIDPRAAATPVDDPEIAEVIDLVDGTILNAREYVASHRYDRLIEERVWMREALKRREPRHICALCGTPVYLVASLRKRFFFRHIHEDGSCRARTRDGLTEDQIRARKYHGLRESEAHRRIKHLIERSLCADPTFVTESILSEARWKAKHNSCLWRQPDVQARAADRRFAFEAQLTTTFLDVVVSRRLFYADEGAILVWVLGSFSPENRRMTTDDLLFSNNSNLFVVDDETTTLSEKRKRFHLRCHFRLPFRSGDGIDERWEETIVGFDELVQDLKDQRIFYFDYEGEESRLRDALDDTLREEFIAFWCESMSPHFCGTPQNIDRWVVFRERFAGRGVTLPIHPGGDPSFRSLIHGVLSAVNGEPVGWQFDRLIQVAHQLAQSHPENLLAFGFALKNAGHQSLLKEQDTTGKWQRKREMFSARVKNRDPECMPGPEWLPVLSFLFPEVGASVIAFLKREPDRIAG